MVTTASAVANHSRRGEIRGLDGDKDRYPAYALNISKTCLPVFNLRIRTLVHIRVTVDLPSDSGGLSSALSMFESRDPSGRSTWYPVFPRDMVCSSSDDEESVRGKTEEDSSTETRQTTRHSRGFSA